MYTFREREYIYNIFDKMAGVRFTVSHSRIGGVQYDITPEVVTEIRAFVKNFYKELAGWNKFINKNPIFVNRVKGIGIVSREEAIGYGFTGPSLRGSGVEYDLRTAEPYLVYDQLQFDVPVRTEGDCMARYFVRMEEMLQSCRIIEQCLDKMPEGIIRNDDAKKSYASKQEVYYSMEGMIHDFMMTDVGTVAPKGAEAYHAIEAPKGELGFYAYSDGTGSPWRLKIKSPSFANLQVLEFMMEGAMLADTVVLIGSIDPVMGECDK
jgi:NADH-quinone oxidoreductase subunit D